jgi:hypothetical protein
LAPGHRWAGDPFSHGFPGLHPPPEDKRRTLSLTAAFRHLFSGRLQLRARNQVMNIRLHNDLETDMILTPSL